jgi:hypothetical protein
VEDGHGPPHRALRALIAAGAVAAAAPAAAEPSHAELVAAGIAMAPPAYFLGVVLHEGSHALAAKALGGEVLSMRLYPGRNPVNGALQFGWVRVRGLRHPAARATMLAAPKLTNLVLLGGYVGLWATDHLPNNPWGHLALQVLATGVWVDFAKDVLVFHSQNDLVKLYALAGLDDEWRRLPLRLLHAAAAAGLAWIVFDGYEQLFASDTGGTAASLTVPLLGGAF